MTAPETPRTPEELEAWADEWSEHDDSGAAAIARLAASLMARLHEHEELFAEHERIREHITELTEKREAALASERARSERLAGALLALYDAAKFMPRGVPGSGGASTVHAFEIQAGVVWDLDLALRRAGATLCAEPSPAAPEQGEIRVVFDGPPGPEAGRFVEVENAAGCSINAGEWRKRSDGLWELVIRGPLPSPLADREAT